MGRELELLSVSQTIQNNIGSLAITWQTQADASWSLTRAMETGIPSSSGRLDSMTSRGPSGSLLF